MLARCLCVIRCSSSWTACQWYASAWIHALLEVRFSWFDPRPMLGRRATSIRSGSRLCPRWALPRRSGSWWVCRCQSGRTLSSRGGMALCTSPLWKHRKRAIQTKDLRNFRIMSHAGFGFRRFSWLGCSLMLVPLGDWNSKPCRHFTETSILYSRNQ